MIVKFSKLKTMIGTAVQRGSTVYVYDEKGHQLTCVSCGSGGQLMGYTGSSFSVKRGSTVYVYDEKGRSLSCHRV